MAEVSSPEFKDLVSCIEGYCLLSSASNMGKDTGSLLCMLYLQEACLASWAKWSGLMDDKLNKKLLTADNRVNETLKKIRQATNDVAADGRFNLHPVTEKKRSIRLDNVSTLHLQYVRKVHIEVLQHAGRLKEENKLPKSLRWKALNQVSFEKLVRTLATYNSRLYESLGTSQQQSAKGDLRLMKLLLISSSKTVHEIRDFQHALEVIDPSDNAHWNLAALRGVRISLEGTSYAPPVLDGRLLDLRGEDTPSLARYGGRPVYLEWKSYGNTKAKGPVVYTRMHDLAAILHAEKPRTILVPHCRGYIHDALKSRYCFILEPPGRQLAPTSWLPPSPHSLMELFKSAWSPSATERVLLARALANCILELHVVNWTHGDLRSDNILFFPAYANAPHNLKDPYLVGFDYRHMGFDTQPKSRFGKGGDIYSLGVVLVEIGKWRSIKVIESEEEAVKAVEHQMGNLYAQAVQRCLQATPAGVVGPEAEVKTLFLDVCIRLSRIVV